MSEDKLQSIEPETQAQVDRVRSKMSELQEALDSNLPGFANILKDIHQSLREDPEVVTILEPEEISTIVKGLEKHAHIVVTPAKAKKAAKSKTPVTASDL